MRLEAFCQRIYDRLMDGVISSNIAKVLAGMEKFDKAANYEKKAFHVLSMFLGTDHKLTKDSEDALKSITKQAVEKKKQKVSVRLVGILSLCS